MTGRLGAPHEWDSVSAATLPRPVPEGCGAEGLHLSRLWSLTWFDLPSGHLQRAWPQPTVKETPLP